MSCERHTGFNNDDDNNSNNNREVFLLKVDLIYILKILPVLISLFLRVATDTGKG